MKLIIQIPCLNEEQTLPATLAELPRAVPGFDIVEWLVIDDGSTDRTVPVARAQGVDHIVRHAHNKGLASAFQTGINACLQLGADVIVTTDADNQYPGRYVSALLRPTLTGEADIVIGDRQTSKIEHFSVLKRILHRLGSSVVRWMSGTTVPDAPSGFRAFTREAALRLNVLTDYTYTLDTIIQAGRKNLKVASIPIQTNAPLRGSRLIRGTFPYVLRSAATILRISILYRPFRTFAIISLPFLVSGAALWLRYLVLWLTQDLPRSAHLASIVVGSVLLIVSLLILLFGLLADILGITRRIQEEALYHAKRLSLSPDVRTSLEEAPNNRVAL